MAQPTELSVGQVAERSGLSISAIHFYEKQGLVTSSRNSSNHRRYRRDVLRRLAVIKVAQRAGVPLKEIAQAMETVPQTGAVSARHWTKLARTWRTDLDDRINRLTRLRDTLGYCIGCGCLSVKDCKLMNPDDALGIEGTGPRLLDPDL